ncbi:hypothetical protein SG34_026325 [Thalassomonas viridans]|uniref:Uncharacterized protein n=1 Tax=Thalassomonas viridans TaxID=137584 RepID=A0AAE9Z1E0_9GAMM|nr:hypothetical protein [Thalassomonas viridans]WDE04788.1 hypothetical protein SG34_026325 [Thalassomonas viridans]
MANINDMPELHSVKVYLTDSIPTRPPSRPPSPPTSESIPRTNKSTLPASHRQANVNGGYHHV